MAESIVLDPPGYFYLSEPGFHFESQGSALLPLYIKQAGVAGSGAVQFWNPPGTDWLLAKPLQFFSNWQNDSGPFQYFNLPKDKWLFATGITAQEFNPADKPGQPAYNADNKWIVIPSVPDDAVALDDASFSSMGSAIGVTLPTNIKTIAQCDNAPTGGPIDAGDYCPYLQLGMYPDPEHAFIFGWSNLAVLFYRDDIHVFQSPPNDRQTWRLLYTINDSKSRTSLEVSQQQQNTGSLLSPSSFNLQIRSLLAATVGPDHVFFATAAGDPVGVNVGNFQTHYGAVEGLNALGPICGRVLPPGSWWFAATPKQRVVAQVQVTGYYAGSAGSPILDPTAREPWFDLGPYYKPTNAPEVAVRVWLPANDLSEIEVTEDTTPGLFGDDLTTTKIRSTSADCALDFAITDETGSTWVSDGTHNEGYWYLLLKGGSFDNDGDPNSSWAYLCPQFKAVQLRFAPQLTPRPYSTLTLNDTQYRSWQCETSLHGTDDKRLVVELLDPGVLRLSQTGHDQREGYPIHVVDSSSGVVRAAGWIANPDLEEIQVEGSTRSYPVRAYRLQAEGMLSRLKDDWLYLPQLCDITGLGYVTHDWAVRESMLFAGIDVDDITRVYIASDPYAGTALSYLPGTAAKVPNTPGVRFDGIWAPDWDETKLQYAERIAYEWREWSLHENFNGRIDYEPDTQLQYLLGVTPTIDAVIYRTKAEAAFYGYPGQYFLAATPARRTLERLSANTVRITGKGSDGDVIAHVIDRDTGSITDTAAFNFVGEPRVLGKTPKLAVGVTEMGQLARVLRLRKARRPQAWSITVPLAPWQIGPAGVAVNSAITIAERGNYVIKHAEVKVRDRDIYRTRLTCERLAL